MTLLTAAYTIAGAGGATLAAWFVTGLVNEHRADRDLARTNPNAKTNNPPTMPAGGRGTTLGELRRLKPANAHTPKHAEEAQTSE